VERAPENLKSDVTAKRAFCVDLVARGFSDPRIIGSPADITANKGSHKWYFEIKYTRKKQNYFGAATLTEWVAASRDPEHFRFVVAYRGEFGWIFDHYTVEEFMAHSYVPPFKIYFNVPIPKPPIRLHQATSKRIRLTEARLRALGDFYETFRTSG